MDTATNGANQIYGLMASVLAEVEAVEKGRTNAHQGYKFRGIDDVYKAVHPLFAKHGIFTLPRVLAENTTERTTESGTVLRFVNLTMAYDFFAPDGSHVTAEVVGEAMDSGDKASNKAMSAAQKYALIQTLCIPTGSTPDADETTHAEITGETRQISKSKTATEKCPDCGGGMWDNREGKRNPKAPDFKCKDKSCGGVVWPERPDSDPYGNEQALRDELFGQAEQFLINKGTPEDKRKDALGRLVMLSTDEMGKVVEKLVSGKGAKPARQSKLELEREKRLQQILNEFDGTDIDNTVARLFDGKELSELSLDALNELYADLIPF